LAVLYRVGEAKNLAASIARAAGVSAEDAAILADSLVEADVHGTATHGLSRLNIYIKRIKLGLIDPAAELRVVSQRDATIAVDACNGLGQVQAVKTLERLFPMAAKRGVAAATIRNSQHFGALSYYCNRAAERAMILIAMTNSEPAMAPTGGFRPFFGTNPIAISLPTGKGFAVKIDMASSIVARGNIIAAQKAGKSIPREWALDAAGNATTDPAKALLGSVLTMAGHKGYALAFMVEVLSGVLSGSAVGDGIGSMYKDQDRTQRVGHFFCLLDIAAFMDPAEFRSRMDAMIDTLKGGPRQPGVDEILVPGEKSHRLACASRASGVAVDPQTHRELEGLCREFRIPVPWK
jgi:LDH2 family malate/lactate/ureidoglycolate dehydrogenase